MSLVLLLDVAHVVLAATFGGPQAAAALTAITVVAVSVLRPQSRPAG